jgi:hypothetical protein
MSKRPSLVEALREAGAASTHPRVNEPTGVGQVDDGKTAGSTTRPASRSGLRAVTCYVRPEAHRQLRLLGLEHGASVQELMCEALNDLFRKHGKAHIGQ